MWFRHLLTNHVLANLGFVLVLVVGWLAYSQMPRAKDPEINFNWINIVTILPGAAAEDIERRITDPLEDSIRRSVQDIRFVSSTSRDGVSNILVRFNQLDERIFDKRLIDLRREVQNTYTDELPDDADSPQVYEITTSNAFPTASVVVTGPGDDVHLRRQARNVKKDLERLAGVDRINDLGLLDPELHIRFLPERLEGLGVTPAALADTVRAYFTDVAAGDIETDSGQWLVRLAGTDTDVTRLARLPIVTARGTVELGSVARIAWGTEEPTEVVRFEGEPAIMFAVVKTANANVLDLVERLRAYLQDRNTLTAVTGVRLALVDDQTTSTSRALQVMQTNAIIGLGLVLVVTWLFLGSRIAALTSLGIPFTLAGTFLILHTTGMSLNNTVLLGVVIALGMLVDDAVVVIEAMYQRLQDGVAGIDAAAGALKEVFAPVTTSVLTTMAAFLPLVLLPGILGEFMRVIPIVVSVGLAVSLLEAYWMLPAHVVAARVNFSRLSRTETIRRAATRALRRGYTRMLLKALRCPAASVSLAVLLFVLAVGTVAGGFVRVNFFEADAIRLFYINVEMPAGTRLGTTNEALAEVERKALSVIEAQELRATVAYTGQIFTETEPLFGDTVGQVMVSLNPATSGARTVAAIAREVDAVVQSVKGPSSISLLELTDGPPTSRAISVKVRGDDFDTIQLATTRMREYLETLPPVSNIGIDYRPGNPEMVLRHNSDAIKRAGLDPTVVSRSISLFVDGEIVTDFQRDGEEVNVRVLPDRTLQGDIGNFLQHTVALSDGRGIALGSLVDVEPGLGQYNIRHYNFRRAITLEADLDKKILDTVSANKQLEEFWESIRNEFPDVDLEFSGELDDIEESLNAIALLFALGIGLIYVILGTQFRSYWQPLLILVTVPLAFTGVVLGLLLTGNPISLYTMYGMVALAGISVNAAIVLISAANQRLALGMGLLHATIYAARRRVIPILITSLTTTAGLVSLAAGFAGRSLIWGPVATAIVWGLAFSTILTLFVVPLLYRTTMRRGQPKTMAAA